MVGSVVVVVASVVVVVGSVVVVVASVVDVVVAIYRNIRRYKPTCDELTFTGVFFFHFISFFDEIHISIQNSPRWDAAFCGVTSGAIPFAYVPYKVRQA